MGGTMSRNKGKRGEREVINEVLQPVVNKVYSEFGVEPPLLQRNTLQSDRGGYDLVGLDWFAPEVKRQETLNISGWWAQCKAQAKPGQIPVLLYRQNHKCWKVVMKGYLSIAPGVRIGAAMEFSLGVFMVYFEQKVRAELKKELGL